jgi:hypothetical protein
MTLNINQFAMSTVQGQMDLQFNGSVISAQVDSTQATNLVAGQAVKLVDSAGGVPKVVGLAANTDSTFGYVIRNLKDVDFPAYAQLEIALQGSVMYMTAGAAIARGASIEVVYTTNKVITNAGVNPVAGYALDKAAADGDLIRVYVLTPAFQSAQVIGDISGLQTALYQRVQTARVVCTLSEINAGKELVPAVTGKSIRVVGLTRRVVGSAAVATSADVQSGTTAVKVMVDAIAALTNGAVIINKETNCVPGAGWAADLPASESLVVANVGSTMTTLTSITYTVSYVYV